MGLSVNCSHGATHGALVCTLCWSKLPMQPLGLLLMITCLMDSFIDFGSYQSLFTVYPSQRTAGAASKRPSTPRGQVDYVPCCIMFTSLYVSDTSFAFLITVIASSPPAPPPLSTSPAAPVLNLNDHLLGPIASRSYKASVCMHVWVRLRKRKKRVIEPVGGAAKASVCLRKKWE